MPKKQPFERPTKGGKYYRVGGKLISAAEYQAREKAKADKPQRKPQTKD